MWRRESILKTYDNSFPEEVIIDGGGFAAAITLIGTEDPSCVIDGFKITGGNAENYPDIGGGISGAGSTATIQNCWITGNTARRYGGGLGNCCGLIKNCIITGNNTPDLGGGVYIGNVDSSRFQLQNNTIAGNYSKQGSALYFSNSPDSEQITNNIFFNNWPSNVFYNAQPTTDKYNLIITGDQFIYPENGGFENGDLTNWNAEIERGDWMDITDVFVENQDLSEGSYHAVLQAGYTEEPSDPFCFESCVADCWMGCLPEDPWCEQDCQMMCEQCLMNVIYFGGKVTLERELEIPHGSISLEFDYNLSTPEGIATISFDYDANGQTDGEYALALQEGDFETVRIPVKGHDLISIFLAFELPDCDSHWEGCNPIPKASLSVDNFRFFGLNNESNGFISPGYWNYVESPDDSIGYYMTNGDYHLLPESLCIDAGDPDYIIDENETDIEGNPRIINSKIDIGAYEYNGGIVWYVNDNAPGDPEPNNLNVSDPLEDGTLDHPFDSIQEAIQTSEHRDTILVLPGKYFENILIQDKGIALRGIGESIPHDVVLEGDGTTSVVTIDGPDDLSCLIEGFSIRGGIAVNGGGINVLGCSVTINKCNFYDNTAGFKGGGIFSCCNTIISDCILSNNSAQIGAGLYAEGGVAGLIDPDSGELYYKEYQQELTGTIIYHNQATNGGGVFISSGKLRSNVILHNKADYGGGIHCQGTELINNTVIENSSVYGGGIYSDHGHSLLRNSIVWNNAADYGHEVALRTGSTVFDISYCDISGGMLEVYSDPNSIIKWLDGNMETDPSFDSSKGFPYWKVNPNTGRLEQVLVKYHLLPNSPCINTGDPNNVISAQIKDIDGEERIFGGIIDIGADELQTTPDYNPETILISGPLENSHNQLPITLEWTGSDDVTLPGNLTYSIKLDEGDWNEFDSTTSIIYDTLDEGEHVFQVKAKDEADNEDSEPEQSTFVIDFTNPGPTLFTSGPAEGQSTILPFAFYWSSTDNLTPQDQLLYTRKLDDLPWSEYENETTTDIIGLSDGPHVFQVMARDLAGNQENPPAIRNFIVDTTPPMISDIQVEPGITQCTITWITNEPARALLNYGLSSNYNQATDQNPDLITEHSVTITGLSSNTPYHFSIESSDQLGHTSYSPDETFQTYSAADLHLVSVNAPADVWEGHMTFDITWTVKNSGTWVLSSNWTDTVYFSTDTVLDTGDISLSQADISGASLAVGESYQRNMTVIVPGGHALGNYHVLVQTDTDNVVAEIGEINNIFAHPLRISEPDPSKPAPNLQAVSLTAPNSTWPQRNFDLSWNVKNVGSTVVEGTWHDSIYLSDDTTLDEGDLLLVSRDSSAVTPLPASEAYTRNINVTLPTNVSLGDKYLILKTDAKGVVLEYVRLNNETTTRIKITASDLIVDQVNAPEEAWVGQNINLSWVVKNHGDGPTGTGSWKDYVYLSADQSLGNDYYLGSATCHSALEPDQAYTQNVLLKLPSNLIGLYYVFVKADADGKVYETGKENNNTNYDPGPMLINLNPVPDLEATILNGPATAISEQTVTLDWTVTNIGPVSTTQGSWTDRIYLSQDGILNTAQDTLLASFLHTGNLAQNGDFYVRSEDVKLPSGISGEFSLFILSDSTNRVYERGAEANNYIDHSITISLQPSPDMLMTSVTVLDSIAGQSVDVSWTVTNDGTGRLAGSWQDAVFLSLDDQYSSSTDTFLDSFGTGGILEVGNSYMKTESISIPDFIEGPYFIIVVTDSGKQIPEYESGAETNNTSSNALNVTWNPPDLFISNISAPSTAMSGTTMLVDWSVVNNGPGSTRTTAWKDSVYFSSDTVLDGADIFLYDFGHTGALGVSDSYTRNQSVLVPNGVSGLYYILITTDSENKELEREGESNNTSSSPLSINISLTPPPNLQVTSVLAPEEGLSGQTIDISWTVINGGTGLTVGSTWSDAIYVSRDASFATIGDNTIIATYQHTGLLEAVAPNNTYTRTETVTLPGNLSGSYYVFAQTDSGNSIYEHLNEDDNAGYDVTPINLTIPRPDLRISSVDAPQDGQSGQYIDVGWSVINEGIDPTGSYWVDSVYLSGDTTWGSDTYLGNLAHNGTLNTNGTYNASATVRLPVGIQGDYYIFVKADNNNHLGEEDELNNTAYDPTAIQITLTPPPDLQVLTVDAPLEGWSGQSLQVIWTVSNEGDGSTIASTWDDRVYLSTDEIFGSDTYLGRFTHTGALSSEESYTRTGTFTLPHDIHGPYYILVVTDYNKRVAEYAGGEGNNVSSYAMQINLTPPPDLQVSSVNGGTAAWSGQGLTIGWTVSNLGQGPTRHNLWQDQIYVSDDEVLDVEQDIELGYVTRSGFLPLNESYTKSSTVTLPQGYEGQYYVFVVTDILNQVPEFDKEGNNSASDPIEVYLTPPPDLQVTSVSAPASGFRGQPISVSWTVENMGIGAVPQGSWYDSVYLSLDQILNTTTDKCFGSLKHTGDMALLGSYTKRELFTLPAEFVGTYYVFIKTDSTNTVYEHQNEGNNAGYVSEPIHITVAEPADLVIAQVNIPATATPGEFASMGYNIANQSGSPAIGGWWDSMYFSEDMAWNLQDSLTTRIQHTIGLAATENRTVNKTVTTPGVVPGDYHVLARADIYNQVEEGDTGEQNNTVSSLGKVHIDVQEIAIGTPVIGTLSTGQYKYYRFEAESGKDLLVTLDSESLDASNELYVRYGAMPDRGHYDYLFSSPFEPDQEIVIPTTKAETYYIMVYGSLVPDGSENYALLIDNLVYSVRSFIPNRVGNTGSVTFNVKGAGFNETQSFFLVQDQEDVVKAEVVIIQSSAEAVVRFDMRNISAGTYDFTVSDPALGRSALVNGLLVQDKNTEQLYTSIIGPDAFRGINSTLTHHIQVGNVGSVDSRAVLTNIQVPAGIQYRVATPGQPIENSQWRTSTGDVPVLFNYLPPGRIEELKLQTIPGGSMPLGVQAVSSELKPQTIESSFDYFGVAYPCYLGKQNNGATPADYNLENGTYANKSFNWLVEDTKINTIEIVVNWYMDNLNSSEIKRHDLTPERNWCHTPDDDDVANVIHRAHAKGLKVILKPHVDVLDAPPEKDWRAHIAPDDLSLWKESYRDFIMHYASVASAHYETGDIFVIGCELISMTTPEHTGFWEQLITDVNAIYNGKITYAANFSGIYSDYIPEYKQIGFWDHEDLDLIGIDAYFKLDAADSSVTQLEKAWKKHKEDIEEWRSQEALSKPVFFPEIGYHSAIDSYKAPWQGDANNLGEPDEDVQYACYEATYKYWSKVPWFDGMLFWAVSPDLKKDFPPGTSTEHKGYSPVYEVEGDIVEKKAAQVLKLEFASESEALEKLKDTIEDDLWEVIEPIIDSEMPEEDRAILKEEIKTIIEDGVEPITSELDDKVFECEPLDFICWISLMVEDMDEVWEIIEEGIRSLGHGEAGEKVINAIKEYSINWFWVRFPYIWENVISETYSALGIRYVPPPSDPNRKLGPKGFGDSQYMSTKAPFLYRIDFENIPEAQSSAQIVEISDPLDIDLDWTTFSLGEMGFSNHTISVPKGLGYYRTQFDLRPEGTDLIVDIEAGINVGTKEVFWRMVGIDPETGELTQDAEVGFLPPNDPNTHIGEGYVTFNIKPKAKCLTGTKITNEASIVFDTNPPLDTGEVFNTIDSGNPVSAVIPLPEFSNGVKFPVDWSGQDDPNGSGVNTYDIYVSDNDGEWSLWQDGVIEMSAEYTGQLGHTYRFFSRSVDNVGNTEVLKTEPDAVISVPDSMDLTLVVQSWNPVSKNRVGRTIFEHMYSLTVQNTSGLDISNVVIDFAAVPSNISILDGQVTIPQILRQLSEISQDTLTIRVDESTPLDLSKIRFTGTFEWTPPGEIQPYPFSARVVFKPASRARGDITLDGKTDIEDIMVMAQLWLSSEEQADIFPANGDGIVNLLDFEVLAKHWLDN